MKLTPFGLLARTLRMKLDVAMKDQASAMGLSPSHLSGIEYGDKKLSGKHIEAAADFFCAKGVKPGELKELRDAGAKSLEVLRAFDLKPDARVELAAFARKLESGKQMPDEFRNWLHSMA